MSGNFVLFFNIPTLRASGRVFEINLYPKKKFYENSAALA